MAARRCSMFVGRDSRPCPRRAGYEVEIYTGSPTNAHPLLVCGGGHLEQALEMASGTSFGEKVTVRVLSS